MKRGYLKPKTVSVQIERMRLMAGSAEKLSGNMQRNPTFNSRSRGMDDEDSWE